MSNQENTYLNKFGEWLIIQGRSSTTAGSYCAAVKRFLEWLDKQNIETENTSYNDVLAYVHYLKNKGCKQRTQQVTVGALKHFFNFLISEETIEENPAGIVLIRGIRRKTLHEILTPEELAAIYKNFNKKGPTNRERKYRHSKTMNWQEEETKSF